MNIIKTFILSIAVGLAGVLTIPAAVAATDVISGTACSGAASANPLCTSRNGAENNLRTQITNITNILMFILGTIAVIVIIIGGIMYVVSVGDPGKAKTAKDTILYAVIGLIVALAAGAIVNFVVNRFMS